MNNLCTDVGYKSLNKYGEMLCGDCVEIVKQDENLLVMVLADGLGSGVKANILSKLTSKILSTMMANTMTVEECVSTIASTLPVCQTRNVAYSTFTVILVSDNDEAEMIQYDNPHVILLRNGINFDYPKISIKIDEKVIYKSKIKIQKDDVFVSMSDGVVYAGVGQKLNFGWQRENIIDYLEAIYNKENSAKTIATLLIDECDRLYASKPGDDTTVGVVKIRKRQPVNLLVGPPANPNDVEKMMSLFFAKEGNHIVCGGTTSCLAAEHLDKPIITKLDYIDPEIPPIAMVEGINLVTEGVITLNRVLEYAKNHLCDNSLYSEWSVKKDGASKISKILFEDATDINFYVGKAINPAHQNPDLPINFNIKMSLVDELSQCLEKMGKRIKVSYF